MTFRAANPYIGTAFAVFPRMSPAVSVVVPTCGRPDLLRRCVAALEAQSLPDDAYEIIVVDDTLTRRGPAATRNIGWRRARAPIVAFTEDDTIADRDWLARGLAAFAPGVDAVIGRIAVALSRERNEQSFEAAEFPTTNCFVRREALVRLRGFDESLGLPWRENSDLHCRLLAAGCIIARAPDALVVHPVRAAPWDARGGRPRWDYYAVVGALAVSPFWPPALLLWTLLTTRFCYYHLRGTTRTPAHVAEVVIRSILIPPLSVCWRVAGALGFREALR
jgi:glycosyl transferase family 2